MRHILFSERKKLSEQAQKWCEECNLPDIPINVVTALNRMGALKRPPSTWLDKKLMQYRYNPVFWYEKYRLKIEEFWQCIKQKG